MTRTCNEEQFAPTCPLVRIAPANTESETTVNHTKLLMPGLLGLALTVSSMSIGAQTLEDNSFSGISRMERLDKNKDGMVSKAEFLAMMGKVYDMKAKEMNVKGGKMKMDDYMAFSAFLSRGEKNK